MKHKIKVCGVPRGKPDSGFLWYASCQGCRWEPNLPAKHHIDGMTFFGRSTWDAAFALGIAHQRNADLKEKLSGV